MSKEIEWIKKMWYLYTIEYFSAIKGGNPATWENMDDLEDIMLSEISQSQDKYCIIPLI